MDVDLTAGTDSTQMATDQIECESGVGSQQKLLELARRLDRFGRDAETFLTVQLDQLSRAIADFEEEKAAWRRQLKRETRQLEAERLRLREESPESSGAGPGSDESEFQRQLSAARTTGHAGVRILLQPERATSSQIGLLLFELSKLNRDTGGKGVSFQVSELRRPKNSLLRRSPLSTGIILELNGDSALPLVPRGQHVELDVDLTDRIEDWIHFKAHLLTTRLQDEELVRQFARGRVIDSNQETDVNSSG